MAILSDDEKRRMLSNGTAIEFSPWSEADEHNPEMRKARVIQAAWINELVDDGDVVRVPIRIDNALIQGELRLCYTTFERTVSITNTAFEDEVDLSFATFKPTACFGGSGFRKSTNWHAIHVQNDLDLTDAHFQERSSFSDLQVDGFFLARRAKYGPVTFERAVVSKAADCEAAEFFGDALLLGTQIKGQALFSGAKFQGPALFIKTKFEHDAVFSSVVFVQQTHFDGATVAGDLVLVPDPNIGLCTQFGREARFVSIHVGGQALFQECCFNDVAYFTGARFGAETSFQGAQFKSTAVFERIRCESFLSFAASPKGQHVIFAGQARFVYAHIGSEASFTGVEFRGNAEFDGSRIEGNAIFSSSAARCVTFGQEARFVGGSITED